VKKRVFVALFALIGMTPSIRAASTRYTFIISDLHFGVGKETGGNEWLPTEDFRWADELKSFLTQLSAETGNNTDLIIAGDMFELWQPLNKSDCEQSNRNFGCSEDEAKARISRVLTEHDSEIKALAEFAKLGTNAITIVPGNHDAALFFPAVQVLVISAFGDAAPRIAISTKGYWLSEDKKILVEHGQQIGRDVNRFDNWPKPFVGPPMALRLQKTWGEQFVQSFYNQYEEKYPVIDNISDNGGISYGLSAEGLKGTGMAVGKFLRFYLAGSSWSQFASSLGGPGDPAPEWDIDRIRANGDVFFYESLPTEDPMRSVAEAAYEEGSLGMTLSDLSDEEIRSICESRLALFRLQTPSPPHPPPTIAPCVSKQPLGAALQAVFGPTRDKLVKARAQELFKNLKMKGELTKTFDLYVYGHTHSAYPPRNINVYPSWTFESVNSGAWQRIASPAQFKSLQCAQHPADALRMSLKRLPSCYSVIRVRPYAVKPSSELLYWTDTGTNGSLGPSCNWAAPACP
jgi:UDP-2,3-diacylglucosamine pyrophosphatase LpxH